MESELSLLKDIFFDLAESTSLKELATVWQEMGLREEVSKTRRETVQLHLGNLLKEIVEEEVKLKDKLVESVRTNEKELENLCRILSLPVDLVSVGMVVISPAFCMWTVGSQLHACMKLHSL